MRLLSGNDAQSGRHRDKQEPLTKGLALLCFDTCLESSARTFLSLLLQQETQWEIVTSCPQREENKTPAVSASPQDVQGDSRWLRMGGFLFKKQCVIIAFRFVKVIRALRRKVQRGT